MLGMIVLESKTRIPVQPQNAVPRPHLFSLLEHQIPHHKLNLISAPAGYGKTTLLAGWARASSLPAAWLSVTGEESDAAGFLRYLLAGWERVQPGIVETPLGILLGTQAPDIKAVLAAFTNAAGQAAQDLVFVIDDYHLIRNAGIHHALTFLLEHLPVNLHFVLAGRSDPPLSLARYRARGQLFELRAGDIRFSREEGAAFLRQSMGLDLSPDIVASLHQETEGWAAGMQLAALTLKQRPPGAQGRPAASGKLRFIADYLREDVLLYLPAGFQDFLLRSSLLERLCGPLCDAVLGGKKGQAMLETLERENLFITPLDDERTWYRYHPLFADFLRGEMGRRFPADIPELHRRAAAWYAARDLPEQAFDHAVAGEDPQQVIGILDQYFNARINSGEVNLVRHWIESTPAAWFAAYPVLDLMRAGLMAFTGEYEACVHLINDVEHRLAPAESESARWQMARVQAVRCFIACMQNDLGQAQAYADRALRELPHEDTSFRPGVYGALGDAYRQNGRWEEARECYLNALGASRSPTVRQYSAHVFGALADLELRQGRLRNAAEYWRKALDAVQERENWGRLPLPVIGWVFIRMGEVLYEQNRLDEAWEHAVRGLERAELGGDARAQIAGCLLAARINRARGDLETAADYLEQARLLVDQFEFPEWTGRFERFQLELWLAQDQHRRAARRAAEILQSSERTGRPARAAVRLASVRALIAAGDAPAIQNAQRLLDDHLEAAKNEGRVGVQIEALALQALADWRGGSLPGAMVSLERALRLAEPEGYVRLFADLGPPMVRLLQEARLRGVNTPYAAILLEAFGSPDGTSATEPALPEPLTQREQEVLELMSAGLTNREIATELVVSPETVKKHSSSIFSKLGVSNRTEAASRARELDILG